MFNYKHCLIILIVTYISLLGWQISPYIFVGHESAEMYTEGCDYKYGVQIEEDDKKIVVDGWIFYPNEQIKTWDVKIALLSEESNLYLLKTNMVKRKDVEDSFKKKYGDDNRLEYSGMHASVYKILLPKGYYKVVIIYNNNDNNRLVYTNQVVSI